MADMDCAGEEICVDAGSALPPPLYTCENTFVIPTQLDGAVVFEGNTGDRVSAESARCAQGAEGPDHVYLLKGEGKFVGGADEAVDVCISTLGSDFDTALHVRRGRCEGAEIECEDDVLVRFGDQEQLQVEARLR